MQPDITFPQKCIWESTLVALGLGYDWSETFGLDASVCESDETIVLVTLYQDHEHTTTK